MLQICPKYREAAALDPSLVDFLAAGSAGWQKDAVILRSLLIDFGDKWEDFGRPGQNLYRPSRKEAVKLRNRMDQVQSTHRLKEHLSQLLGCDTDEWVTTEQWEEVLPKSLEEYRPFMASCVEEARSTNADEAMATARANKLWPFDRR
ncbi:hypothetical protein K431DRAFT_291298 [Polychaeton citri CBS 116435]|uniref:Uncharacterized protein n=1 Tax=Polychaeton citri CBS 116435 TaxID=1314669 RepID=A0A9P4QGV0_9PEZI|nr:hypothetical protein K431DRAFT_291298 [Polychaeton citri CBS 116435]